MIFVTLFFAVFYSIFLAYKLFQREKFGTGDVILLLSNSFIYFGFGYFILAAHDTGEQFLGLFTLFNAILHIIVGVIIYRMEVADRNLLYFVTGLAVVFIAIAIPVQADGSWVSLLWIGQATVLFWIGRTKKVSLYENLSYPIMILALISLVVNWISFYNIGYPIMPWEAITSFYNPIFLTSLLFIAAFGYINYLNNNREHVSLAGLQKTLKVMANYSIPAVLLILTYYAFRLEISAYWNQLYVDTKAEAADVFRDDLNSFRKMWLINYSLLFAVILSWVNFLKHKNRNLGLVNIVFNVFVLMVFLTQGLITLGELRDSFLSQSLSEYYNISSFNIWIRYISYVFAGGLIISIYKYVNKDFMKPFAGKWRIACELFICASLLIIISSEFIQWMDIMDAARSFKLGLSILWGLYALVLIVFGIWKNLQYLRIAAIVLFGFTLIKLFFYDIIHLNALEKTVVFISLGALLLVISFLYNKYKHLISSKEEG